MLTLWLKGLTSPPSERKSKSILIFPSGSIFDHQVTDTLVSSAWKAIVSKTPQKLPKTPQILAKTPQNSQKRALLYMKLPKTLRRYFFTSIGLFLVIPLHQRTERWIVKTENWPSHCASKLSPWDRVDEEHSDGGGGHNAHPLIRSSFFDILTQW